MLFFLHLTLYIFFILFCFFLFFLFFFFFFQAEDGIRDLTVTGVQTCALPICGQSLQGRGEDRSTARHDVDLAGRLERNHLPRALSARFRTASVVPTASMETSRAPSFRYQSMTGAVWRWYTASRFRTASGSSSFRLTSVPPHFSHFVPGSRPVYGVWQLSQTVRPLRRFTSSSSGTSKVSTASRRRPSSFRTRCSPAACGSVRTTPSRIAPFAAPGAPNASFMMP